MEIKQQSNEQATTKTRSKHKNKTKTRKTTKHSKTKQKPTDCNKMATVDTGKKSWKNSALAKYTTSYWPTYDRSGKVATHFKCLL